MVEVSIMKKILIISTSLRKDSNSEYLAKKFEKRGKKSRQLGRIYYP